MLLDEEDEPEEPLFNMERYGGQVSSCARRGVVLDALGGLLTRSQRDPSCTRSCVRLRKWGLSPMGEEVLSEACLAAGSEGEGSCFEYCALRE